MLTPDALQSSRATAGRSNTPQTLSQTPGTLRGRAVTCCDCSDVDPTTRARLAMYAYAFIKLALIGALAALLLPLKRNERPNYTALLIVGAGFLLWYAYLPFCICRVHRCAHPAQPPYRALAEPADRAV